VLFFALLPTLLGAGFLADFSTFLFTFFFAVFARIGDTPWAVTPVGTSGRGGIHNCSVA
jgi:hypothetical protein